MVCVVDVNSKTIAALAPKSNEQHYEILPFPQYQHPINPTLAIS